MTRAGRDQRFRAPQADGEILCAPSRQHLLDLLENNRNQCSATTQKLWGEPRAELMAEAGREVVAAASQYTRSYANVPQPLSADGPLIFTGHQPTLVHPGVWLKNFAAARLAKASAGMAINLIIDSDLCQAATVHVPTGSVNEPYLEAIDFDAQQNTLPYEERKILDLARWESFSQRMTASLRPLVDRPIATNWWRESAVRLRSTNSLGLAIAQARHRLELEWGSVSWEIPQSLVCQTKSFRRFALHLLNDAQRLRKSYNDSLAEYRAVHRLRSPAQPMPDLSESDHWCETPFWFWTSSQPRRRALYVRDERDQLLLSDLAGWQDALPKAIEPALERLATWETHGVKLRTRALTTTLYTRLLLADLFIHGIGGSKYDQVTDAICERFFEICLPPYATLSGTLRLPIDHPTLQPNQAQLLRQQLRDLKFHPERHLDSLDLNPADRQQLADWVSQKKSWVKSTMTIKNADQRHSGIVAANEAMQPWVASLRTEWEQELLVVTRQTGANQVLESREYPFCLFPHKQLCDFLLDF